MARPDPKLLRRKHRSFNPTVWPIADRIYFSPTLLSTGLLAGITSIRGHHVTHCFQPRIAALAPNLSPPRDEPVQLSQTLNRTTQPSKSPSRLELIQSPNPFSQPPLPSPRLS
eukprot:GFKZ01013310.1.p1 GENE.GFKZ01013310.1~~GFKZ01013310.1.p1  ORF type:complete len:113 (+),score=1.05 GFKZ01013310.1:219-557(+)